MVGQKHRSTWTCQNNYQVPHWILNNRFGINPINDTSVEEEEVHILIFDLSSGGRTLAVTPFCIRKGGSQL